MGRGRFTLLVFIMNYLIMMGQIYEADLIYKADLINEIK